MKRYIYTLIVAALLSLTSCVTDDPYVNGVGPNVTPNADKGLKIIGIAEDYDKVNVSTRASEEFSDSRITEMTMFIFKGDGTMIQGYNSFQQPISSAVNIRKPNPTFLINASEYDGTGIIASMDVGVDIRYYRNDETDLGECSIYIVANAYHQISHLIDSNDENGEIKSLTDLNNVLLDIDATLSMPKDSEGNYIGFPMIGTHEGTFDLSYSAEGNSDVANIPMKKVHSKILFTMQVNANQVVVGGPTPKFTIDRAEVYNVPKQARMGKYTDDYIDNVGDNYQFEFVDGNPDTTDDEPFVLSGSDFSNKEIYHTTSVDLLPGSSDLIEFGFYLPEHMVTPQSSFGYPENIPEDLKQYYKPKGVEGQKATFVRIHGSYNDHNGHIKKVSFDIYLGQNHTNSFEVRRNQQLTNKLIITGVTNHKDAYGENQTNISVDHRVNVSDQGYNLYMEREAILDAHFEVRPIDIELQKGSSMKIVIPTEAQSWIALEGDDVARSGVNPSLYIDNTNERRGVRKYFTTDLVTELNGTNQGEILLQHSSCTGGTNEHPEYFRVWFYFDENPNVYDQTFEKDTSVDGGGYTISDRLYRMMPVEFYYSKDATEEPDTSLAPVQVINFQQWNLWRVKTANRFYDIEHEEEYLNNYASNVGYGPKQNGMAWGLDGLQLSDTVQAFAVNFGNNSSGGNIFEIIWNYILDIIEYIVNNAVSAKKPFYDFYNSQKEATDCGLNGTANQYFPYNGYEFCKKIITKANASDNANHHIQQLWLNQSPKSAVEYCYNKNKRNGDTGLVDDTDLHWYLPAIDEIQDIASECYGEFEGVFQDNFYWSSQPAYSLSNWSISYLGNHTGTLYYDNTNCARATKAIVSAYGEFTYVPSRMTASDEHWQFYPQENVGSWWNPQYVYPDPTITPATSTTTDPGYMSRTAEADHCRIRAVYRSGAIQ